MNIKRMVSYIGVAIVAISCQMRANEKGILIQCEYPEYPSERFFIYSEGESFILEYKVFRKEQDSLYHAGDKQVFRKVLKRSQQDSSLFVIKVLSTDSLTYSTAADLEFRRDSVTGLLNIIEEDKTKWTLRDSVMVPELILARKCPMSKKSYSILVQILDDIRNSKSVERPCMDGSQVRIFSQDFKKTITDCDDEGRELGNQLDKHLRGVLSSN